VGICTIGKPDYRLMEVALCLLSSAVN